MAKGISRKQQQAPRHRLLFLFPEGSLLPEAYLEEIRSRLKPEFLERCDFQTLDEVSPSPTGIAESFDYVVLLKNQVPDRQISVVEFLKLTLDLPAKSDVCYTLRFKGKNLSETGGLLLSAALYTYLQRIWKSRRPLSPSLAQHLMEKDGISLREMILHQEPPFTRSGFSFHETKQKLGLNLLWNTVLPIRELRDPVLKTLRAGREHPLLRLGFFLASLAIFVLLPLLSLDAGLSGDDEKHYLHAAKVFRYFTEDDPAALNDPQYKLNYYGQSFDFFTYLIIRWFGLEENPYEARHVMVALSGAAAMLFTALLVRIFAGYRGALLALLLMFLSPRFLGHSFNNPMDVPFALGNIFFLYHMILFLRKLPEYHFRHVIWMALAIAWTNGIRIGGLLLIPYLFMFAGLYLLIHKWPWKFFSPGWWRFALKGLGILVIISLSGYFLSLLTWPYALQDVVNHPIKSFQVMSNIQVSIRVLYDGVVQWSDRLPWHYIPRNILLTVPVLILLAWWLSILTWVTDRKNGNGYWYFVLWFTALFPVLFIIYRESNVYGGWRHMMFIYPSILALAAISLSSLLARMRKNWSRALVLVIILAGILHPLRHVLLNHPNTYIYFNEWAGGINNTYGKLETDYYANSLKPASDLFLDEVLPSWKEDHDYPVKVASNFNVGYYFRNHREDVQSFYSRYYDRGKKDWDYAILYCNYIHPFQLKNGLWPPKNTIHEVKVDDVVVAAIVERKNRTDYYGSSLLEEGMQEQDGLKLEQALEYLEQAVEYDSTNEAALLDLGNNYTGFLLFDEARETMDRLLEIYPDYDKALNLKGYSYLVEAEYYSDISLVDNAIRYINMAIRSNYKFYSGYYNLGLCYGLKNDFGNAEYNLQQAIKFNSRFVPAYEKLAEIYEAIGDPGTAELVRDQMRRVQ